VCRDGAPTLPAPRGPLTISLAAYLLGGGTSTLRTPPRDGDDPIANEDLQLALYCCYELHYRSFAGVPDSLEWDPELIGFRAALEHRFERSLPGLAADEATDPSRIGETLFRLAEADDSPSLAAHLETAASAERFREFMIHRSAYQLKEADPHTWAIPRLDGAAKAALVEVQADEYGGGEPTRMHSRLFADAMSELGLDSSYGAYLDAVPASTLATVNLVSLFGLHRRWRGSLVGHLAMFEITSPGPNRRYAAALRRMGFGQRATAFYDEHVEADSIHENIAAYDLAQGLAMAEPALTHDILLGASALLHFEGEMARRVTAAWDEGRTSLTDRGAQLTRAA
jgi:hypothetical protein